MYRPVKITFGEADHRYINLKTSASARARYRVVEKYKGDVYLDANCEGLLEEEFSVPSIAFSHLEAALTYKISLG